MLTATESEQRYMECEQYDCCKQYYHGRCINMAWVSDCRYTIRPHWEQKYKESLRREFADKCNDPDYRQTKRGDGNDYSGKRI